MSQIFEKPVVSLRNVEPLIVQDNHTSTAKIPSYQRVPNHKNVRSRCQTVIQPDEQREQWDEDSTPSMAASSHVSSLQDPITVEPSEQRDQAYRATEPSSFNGGASHVQEPIQSLPDPLSMALDISPHSSSAKRYFVGVLLQLFRFCIVGGLNTFVDILIFNVFVWSFPTQNSILLIVYNSLAYLIGAVNSFCWNKLWTFKQRSGVTHTQLMRFAVVTGLGIICNDAFLWLATTILSELSLTSFLWTNVAKVSAIGGSVAVSYLGMRFGVFAEKYSTPEGGIARLPPDQ